MVASDRDGEIRTPVIEGPAEERNRGSQDKRETSGKAKEKFSKKRWYRDIHPVDRRTSDIPLIRYCLEFNEGLLVTRV